VILEKNESVLSASNGNSKGGRACVLNVVVLVEKADCYRQMSLGLQNVEAYVDALRVLLGF
jgi:hypothetical protein